MKAVVMAGGEGSRLRPLTIRRPKPMVPIVGKPVMEHILNLLKRHGITRIEARGQPFDPNLHQAVMQQPSREPPNTVLEVLEQGFMIHDRVLRPARVIVSVPAQTEKTK